MNMSLSPIFPWSALPEFTVTSQTFASGQVLPAPLLSKIFGVAGGEDVSPELSWSGFPSDTQSFAITAYDPDAPTGSGFWHWALFNIPATTTHLPLGAGFPGSDLLPHGSVTLKNDAGFAGYIGAAPPAGHGPHRYVFTVFALDVPQLDLTAEASPALLGFNLFSHTLAYGKLVGLYTQLSSA